MLILFEYSTARETTFSFCRRPEKMVFPKKLHWNFMYYQERWYFIFPEIWSYPLNEKKISKKTYDLKKKIHMIFSSNVLKRLSFQKNCAGTWFLVLSGKIEFFFLKTWYFSFGREAKEGPSQEIHGGAIFSVNTCRYYKHDIMPLCQKKSNMILSRKNTPKSDWHSRLTF